MTYDLTLTPVDVPESGTAVAGAAVGLAALLEARRRKGAK
jgi:hypothetical protein